MPLYSYVCTACNHDFETLVTTGESPVCPACGSSALNRRIGTIAPDAKSPGLLKKGRQQAAREGHFSNYSRSDRAKI
jgi:putative FmdB family regulatory protein